MFFPVSFWCYGEEFVCSFYFDFPVLGPYLVIWFGVFQLHFSQQFLPSSRQIFVNVDTSQFKLRSCSVDRRSWTISWKLGNDWPMDQTTLLIVLSSFTHSIWSVDVLWLEVTFSFFLVILQISWLLCSLAVSLTIRNSKKEKKKKS